MEGHAFLARYSIFWQLPGIRGIDNPMLEEEREVLDKDLTEKKQEAKREAQSRFGLNVEPDARLFVSLGRLVRQKGVDILADVAEWLLSSYPEAQLLVIGPPADGFGFYAQRKLEALAEKAAFKRSLERPFQVHCGTSAFRVSDGVQQPHVQKGALLKHTVVSWLCVWHRGCEGRATRNSISLPKRPWMAPFFMAPLSEELSEGRKPSILSYPNAPNSPWSLKT